MDPQNTNPVVPSSSPQEPTPPAPVQPSPESNPAPAPAPDAAPVTPMGGQPAPSTPNNGPNKGMLIGIGAGVVVIVVIAIVVIFSMLSVSKKDYQDALSQYNDVSDANYTLTSKVSSLQYGLSTGTETSFNNDVDAAKKAIDGLKTENEKLGKLKAMSVGDGKQKYDTFNTKLDAYMKYADNLLTSLKDARGATDKCDSNSFSSASQASQIKSAIDDCVTALDKISNTPDADIKQFISKLKDEYQNLSSVVTKLAAITDPYGAQYDQYSSLRDQMYDIEENISDASTDFQSNLEKHADAVDPKDAAKDLGKFLEDKSSN